jgi:glutamate-ammonia-ligase adenylyltransferase
MFSSSQTRILEYSPFLSRLIERHPDWMEALQASGRLENTSPPGSEPLNALIEKHGLDPALRQFRNREMMRLIWRDLNELAEVDEILADLSTLADLCLQAATGFHSVAYEEKHGIPRNSEGRPQKIIIMGLGKLGGRELNLSSDIDIIFCYPEQGICDGRRGLANEQFFTRLARSIIRSLSDSTADGFCFRVDTRLRPFGDSGPLVSSFAALEQYYQREGRDWERYALIKARPVAGDMVSGEQLVSLLRPFVYRRYIDFGAIEALRSMHASVREDALRKDRLDDIKRGPGGIREIEFLVQTLQLLRGGREPELQTPSIFKATATLCKLHMLNDESAAELLTAYRFLRRTENRIQALHDQQTHQVPAGEDGLRVARAMGFRDFPEFRLALEHTRNRVQHLFAQCLPQPVDAADATDRWSAYWQRLRNSAQHDVPEVTEGTALAGFVKRLNRLSLSQRASQRLDQFMPILLERFATLSLDEASVNRVLDLVSAICRRSAYLSLLVQNPAATRSMLELFVASRPVAEAVTRYPALLDELIDPSLGACPPTLEDIQAGVQRVLDRSGDPETTLQDLNYFKQMTNLRIAVAVLKSTMPAIEASTALSRLAQNLVQAVLKLSQDEIKTRHGRMPGPGLAVIAYGSLGACSLSFESDLDLIFLYQSGHQVSDGAHPLSAERYHTRVARRMLSLMSAITPSGRLYSIDARLRPNGRAGLLVSGIEAFKRYQAEVAWVWELQALTRARPVAGDMQTAGVFAAIRQQVLTTTRDRSLLKTEVRDMRERIRAERGDANVLKDGRGGLLDIEFVVQLGVLLNADEYPALVGSTETRCQLQALHECGWIDTNAFKTLDSAYTQLSQARLHSALVDDGAGPGTASLPGQAQTFCDEILG